jgi:hypothetical protein
VLEVSTVADVALAIRVDDKKYMWDGKLYETEDEARKVKEEYEKENFEVHITKGEEGKFLVYSRRVVTEVVVEGEAPI